ncbi:MAG: arginase family protein [Bacteroidales bacterium]|nr:arginase family protein [Bacteroidales bacterium]
MEKSLNFIDSGDYHYVSALMLEGIREPFSLVLLDNHPDMQSPAFGGDILSCGGWVRWALERMPMLQRVIIIGIDPELAGETEGFGDRLTVLPREEKDSGKEQLAALKTWLEASQEPVYLSVDKDVLAPEFASTDWSQGTMTLDTLLEICGTVAGSGRLLGTDVCGELTAAKGGAEKDFIKNSDVNNKIYQNLFLYLKD